MNPEDQPIKIPNPVEGIIRSAAIEDIMSEPSSVQEAVNMHFDRMGATTVRPGLTPYTAVLSGSPSYLTAWSTTDSTTPYVNPQLIAQVGNQVQSYNGSTWSVKGTNTSSNHIHATQFINFTYFVNGNNGDPMQSYDGNTYSTANTGSFGAGDYVSGGLEGRLWMADNKTNRIYYSDQTPTGTALVGGTDYIYFSPPQGQYINAMQLYQRAMMVFTQDYIYRVYGATSYDPYPAYFVGTYSQNSIIQAKDAMYFHHGSTGFYRFTYDQQPQEISRRIIDVVQAIPRANWGSVFGWSDFDHVYWACGEVTVGGTHFRNLVCRYTISTQVWTLYDYFGSSTSSRTITTAITYDDTFDLHRLVGVSDGNVAQVNSGTTDLGEPIFYTEVGRWINLTNLQSAYQQVKSMAVMHINGAGANLDAQTDKSVPDKWINIGKYDQNFVTLFQSVETNVLPFNRIRFRTSGSSKGVGPIFGTKEIITYDNLGFTYQ